MRIIYTAGVFDLLHYGHRHVLLESAALGDRLIVGVVEDASYKGVRPVWSFSRRLAEVEALPQVVLAVRQRGTDPTEVIERLDALGLRPDVMTHGGDWDRLKEGHETLDALGIEWVKVPLVGDVSSTAIRQTIDSIRNGDSFATAGGRP